MEKRHGNKILFVDDDMNLLDGYKRTLRKDFVITVADSGEDMGIGNTWLVEIAAMLSQIGCVTVPDAIIEKVFSGKPLSKAEQAMYDTYPKVGADIIKNIPRMEKAANLIGLLNRPVDATATDIPIEAKILQLALDHDLLVMSGLDTAAALVELYKREGQYEPNALTALEKLISVENKYEIKQELI